MTHAPTASGPRSSPNPPWWNPGDHAASNRAAWLLTGLALIPIVIAVVRAVAGDWIPVGDVGLLALRVDDVMSRHHPWLGSWTSASLSLGIDVNNPGAWYAYLAKPLVAVFGPEAGVPIAVGLLNAGAVVGIGVAARSLGAMSARLWLLTAATALSWSMGSEMLVDLWQPHALLLPLLLFLVLAAGVAAGRGRFLPPFVVVASLIVQTHLGHTYILLLLGAVALGSGARVRWRDGWPGLAPLLRSRPVAWSAAGAVVMWLPALIEQVAHGSDGNLWRLATNPGGGDTTVGLGQATRITARVFAVPPFWSRDSFDSAIPSTPRVSVGGETTVMIPGLPGAAVSVLGLVVLIALAVTLLVWAQRVGRPTLGAALLIAIVSAPISIVSLTILTVGPTGFAGHHARWAFALAVYAHFVLIWAAAEWLRCRYRDRPGMGWIAVATPVAAMVVFVVLNLPAYAQDAGPVADRWARPTLHEIDAQLAGVTLPEPVVFGTDDLRPFEPYSGVVMMWLGEAGVDFRVTGSWYHQVGEGRRVDGSEVGVLHQLEGTDAMLYHGEDCVVVDADGVSDEERARLSELTMDLTRRLIDGGIVLDHDVIGGDPRLVALDQALADSDLGAVQRVVLDGVLTEWAELGAVDPETAAVLAADGDAIAAWVRSAYGLYLTTDAACAI